MEVDEINNAEIMQKAVEDFSRIQDWMLLAEQESDVYKAMFKRYIELKVILSSLGVNLLELDRIKA